MKDLLSTFENMKPETIVVLLLAAILLIFLLVLIIVTIRVLKSGEDTEEDDEEYVKRKNSKEDDEDEEEDDTSKKIQEAVESVEKMRSKNMKEELSEIDSEDDDSEDDDSEDDDDSEEDEAKKAARAKVEEIAKAVRKDNTDDSEDDDSEDDDDDDDEDTKSDDSESEDEETDDDSEDDYDDDVNEPTGKLDSVRIEEELKKVRKEAEDNQEALNEAAKLKVESPYYNASFDSAFVDKPSIEEEKAEPVIPNPTPESVIAEVKEAAKVKERKGSAKAKDAVDVADEKKADASGTAPSGNTLDASEVKEVRGKVKAARRAEKITVNPVNEVNINTVNAVKEVDTKNPKAGISGMEDMKEFMEEHPEPKVKKRKVKKKDRYYEDKFGTHGDEIKTAKYYWYNTQDIEGLARKEDMYFKCHYFEDADNIILDLITEMYDCAYVRTEQLQRIAYGITFKSLGMKEILRSEEDLSFNKDKATKEPTDSDKEEIYKKWCSYVDSFMNIIEINAPESVKEYVVEKMYDYGHRDVEELMYSPY